ncbi:hypothetical protein LTR86_001782, partial [Recurvomyces mirabilis]
MAAVKLRNKPSVGWLPLILFSTSNLTTTAYWNRDFYVTTSGIQSKAVLDLTLASLGQDRVMFSVEYPFEDDVELGTWFDRIEMSVGAREKIA